MFSNLGFFHLKYELYKFIVKFRMTVELQKKNILYTWTNNATSKVHSVKVDDIYYPSRIVTIFIFKYFPLY